MKYSNKHEEYVAQVAAEHGTDGGRVEAPTGWYAKVDLDANRGGYEKDAVDYYDTRFFIVRENDAGQVFLYRYTHADIRDRSFQSFENAYALWDAEITDEQAIEAINGYREAALYTATDEAGNPLDNGELSWSGDAQNTIRNEVIEFITANADDCKEFVDGRTWTQVGIDFSLTRNRHGAGFWDRGAGDVGTRLTEAAHPYGEQHVYIGSTGELEVQ